MYEGRGFLNQGQHTQNLYGSEYNSIGIGIAFIGNYEITKPAYNQVNLLKEFIKMFVANGSIAEDHIIILQDDLMFIEKTAEALNEDIMSFENFRKCKIN